MSSTISTARRVAATRMPNGQVAYFLFEETYESNLYPHTPHWSCVGIGALEDSLRRIFGLASSCEGGCLKNPSGRMTPEGYAATWLKELANPFQLRASRHRLAVGNGTFDALTPDSVGRAASALAETGFGEAAAELQATRGISLDLPHDAPLAVFLHQRLKVLTWRIAPACMVPQPHHERADGLGHQPTPARKVALAFPAAMRVGHDTILMRRTDGSWACEQGQYWVVSKYFERLWEEEGAEPGGYARKVRALRKALEDAPRAPDGLRVRVYPARADSEWSATSIREIQAEARIAPGDQPFEVTLGEGNAYKLTALQPQCADWLVDEPMAGSPSAPRQPELAL